MGNTSGGVNEDQNRFCICMIDKENNNNTENSKWIFCESCQRWYHIICVLMTEEDYENIQKNNEKWYCDLYQCQVNKQQFSKKSITSKNYVNADPINLQTKTNPQNSQNETKCKKCSFIAKNNRGLKVHQRKHKNNSGDDDSITNKGENIENNQEGSKN